MLAAGRWSRPAPNEPSPYETQDASVDLYQPAGARRLGRRRSGRRRSAPQAARRPVLRYGEENGSDALRDQGWTLAASLFGRESETLLQLVSLIESPTFVML